MNRPRYRIRWEQLCCTRPGNHLRCPFPNPYWRWNR